MFSVRSCSAAGDEALDALDVPGAVGLRDRLGAAGADVGAGVRLGEHHGGAPAALDGARPTASAPSVPSAVEHVREGRAGGVHADGGLAPSISSASGPPQRAGRGVPPSSSGRSEAPELGVHEGLVGLLERLGQRRPCAVAGSNTGGLRSASAKTRPAVPAASRVDLGEDACGRCRRPGRRTARCPGRSSGPSTSKRLNSRSRRLLL